MTADKDDLLNFIADCKLEVDYDADVPEPGAGYVDCSTFTISGSLYNLGLFLQVFGIERRHEETWDEAITRELEADADTVRPLADEPGELMEQDVVPPSPIVLGEECSHRWIVQPGDKSVVICVDCGIRYSAAVRHPTSDHER